MEVQRCSVARHYFLLPAGQVTGARKSLVKFSLTCSSCNWQLRINSRLPNWRQIVMLVKLGLSDTIKQLKQKEENLGIFSHKISSRKVKKYPIYIFNSSVKSSAFELDRYVPEQKGRNIGVFKHLKTAVVPCTPSF